jgi:hypothetical protein
MRKIILLLTAVALVFSAVNIFTACNKKDGVYKPKEKISKIYSEVITVYEDSTGSRDTIREKTLEEVWKWDKNKLMQIESSDYAWAWNFVYKGKQVIKIESPETTIQFTYGDKSRLEKIEVLDDREREVMSITVSGRDDDKITKLTYSLHRYEKSLKAQSLFFEKLQPVMRVVLGENLGETMLSNIAANERVHKATTIIKITVDLTYQGNNVSQAKWIYDDEPIPIVYTYTYDNKVNPYYRAISLMSTQDVDQVLTHSTFDFNLFPCSENNVLSYEEKIDTARTSYKYEYRYDSKDFPEKQSKLVNGVKTTMDEIKYTQYFTYYYEYKD